MTDSGRPHAKAQLRLSVSLCDPDAVLTPERREARDEALRRLSDARRQGPTTTERVT